MTKVSIEKNIRTMALQQPHFFVSFIFRTHWLDGYIYLSLFGSSTYRWCLYVLQKWIFIGCAQKCKLTIIYILCFGYEKKLVNGEVHRGRICTFLARQVSRTAFLMRGYLYMTVFSGSIGLVVTYCWKVYLLRWSLKGAVY